MTPQEILKNLCVRYGLSSSYGASLLPLVERAVHAPPDVRKRLLELISAHLDREAKRRAQRDQVAPDRELLSLVARIVHPWSPPEWLMRWTKGDTLPRPGMGTEADEEEPPERARDAG